MAEAFNMSKYLDRVQRTAMEHLSAASTPDDLVGMMKRVTEAAEEELANHRDNSEHIACKAGCGTCCAVTVAVLFPEIVAIDKFVKTHLAPEKQRLIVQRVAELFRKVRWLDEEERLFLRQSCAFLDEAGSCMIYPVRPLICRSITSVDVRHCEEALVAPVLGEVRTVLMNLFQKDLMEETFSIVGQVQAQLGFMDRGGQLTPGIQLLLETPELAERFLARKNVWNDSSGA